MENWIEKMIERQTIPKPLREGTVEDFCKIYDIDRRTYYYQVAKKENQDRIVKNCLILAKEYTPEIVDKLAQKAKGGDMKAIDMFLNYILELSENLDVKSGGERMGLFDFTKQNGKLNRPNNSDQQNKKDEEENTSDTGRNIGI